MPGNSFGQLYRVTSFGESHGKAVGGIIDGCPAGLSIDFNFIDSELKRRNPVFTGTTPRKEPDRVEWFSGLLGSMAMGTPIAFLVQNELQQPEAYDPLVDVYRPSHADFSYERKYGIRDFRGGGRASGRETVVRVVAGAIAKLILKQFGVRIDGFISQIGSLQLMQYPMDSPLNRNTDSDLPLTDPSREAEVIDLISKAAETGDTMGGAVICRVADVPAGIGEPVFDKLQADLAKAMLSIGTAKAFEYGLGFQAAGMKGSEHNDKMSVDRGKVAFITNHDGGIQGGISNGEEIYFRVGFKPVPSIHQPQQMVGSNMETSEVTIHGRHDTCHIPRLVVIVEAMAALVVADHLLRNRAARLQ
jgi:chorismate synthase